jgi:hypothetical protein
LASSSPSSLASSSRIDAKEDTEDVERNYQNCYSDRPLGRATCLYEQWRRPAACCRASMIGSAGGHGCQFGVSSSKSVHSLRNDLKGDLHQEAAGCIGSVQDGLHSIHCQLLQCSATAGMQWQWQNLLHTLLSWRWPFLHQCCVFVPFNITNLHCDKNHYGMYSQIIL